MLTDEKQISAAPLVVPDVVNPAADTSGERAQAALAESLTRFAVDTLPRKSRTPVMVRQIALLEQGGGHVLPDCCWRGKGRGRMAPNNRIDTGKGSIR